MGFLWARDWSFYFSEERGSQIFFFRIGQTSTRDFMCVFVGGGGGRWNEISKKWKSRRQLLHNVYALDLEIEITTFLWRTWPFLKHEMVSVNGSWFTTQLFKLTWVRLKLTWKLKIWNSRVPTFSLEIFYIKCSEVTLFLSFCLRNTYWTLIPQKQTIMKSYPIADRHKQAHGNREAEWRTSPITK